MQNSHLTGEETSAKTREEVREACGGIPLLTDLCLAMRSDPLGMIRVLGELVSCVYGPVVTYVFPDPLVAAYRHSVVHVSLISVLDGTARQEEFRPRMSETVVFGKIKDQELIVLNFRGQLQCRMGGKREGPIELYPKFWNLKSVARDMRKLLRIRAWTKSFEFTQKTRRSHRTLPKILELEISSKRHEETLEDPGLDEELRAGNKTRAGCVTHRDSRVPEFPANDAGNE